MFNLLEKHSKRGNQQKPSAAEHRSARSLKYQHNINSERTVLLGEKQLDAGLVQE